MKILVLIIAVLIYIQPSLAGGCDTQMDQPETQISSSMEDCCGNSDEADSAGECEDSMHCGVCVSGAAILFQGISSPELASISAVPVPATAPLLLAHTSTLFRPPIS